MKQVSGYFNRSGFFFFQAEDGIRYTSVTGVQTCALPICDDEKDWLMFNGLQGSSYVVQTVSLGGDANFAVYEIGRASCRERV